MEWFQGGVGEAIAEAKKNDSVFVVVVKGDKGDEATQALTSLLGDEEIYTKFSSMVCIELENGSPTCAQFSAIYPVILIPSIYFIDSSTGVDLEIVGGVITKEKVLASFDNLKNKSKSANNSPVESVVSKSETGASSSANAPVVIDSPARSTSAAGKPSLEERVQKAKALAAQRQAEREETEKNKEKSEETQRRELGKQMAELKADREEQEAKEAAIQRKKDKAEEKIAREKVKAAIEQDRLDRKVKYDAEKKVADEKKAEVERNRMIEAAAEAEASAVARASISRLQFRLPDGRSQTKQFPAETPLSEVYSFVSSEVVDSVFGKFSLKTTFPRHSLDTLPKDSSLRSLSLVPSATVLVLPAGGVLATGDGGLVSFVWLLLSPLTFLWGLLSGLFQPAGAGGTPAQQRQGPQPSTQRLGRIRHGEGDDENNTWNGNSTQQM